MEDLVQVSKSDGKTPFKPSTLYKWHHLKKHPEIFKKFGGVLFVDTEALRRAIKGDPEARREG
jgi:hypothetical protein